MCVNNVYVCVVADAAKKAAENGELRKGEDQADSGVESPNQTTAVVAAVKQKADAATDTVVDAATTPTPPSPAKSEKGTL